MAEKRRHTRVVHRDVVRFDVAGTTIEGLSVDISRTGIQVEVAVPHSFDHVEMIRFALPERESELEIPVRVARKSDEADGSGPYTLAFEFLRSADPEIRLIENYIRELKTRDQSGNDRRVPRVDCSIPVDCGAGITHATIRNISPEGILVSADGAITVGTDVGVTFRLPGDDRPIRGLCRVAYVISGRPDELSRFGAPFEELSTVFCARIHAFIERNAATRSLRSVWTQLQKTPDEGYRTDDRELPRIIRETPGLLFHLLFERDLTIHTGHLVAGDADITLRIVPAVSAEIAPGDAVFVSFIAEGSNFYFAARVVASGEAASSDETLLTIHAPHRIHRSDNRSNLRTPVTSEDEIAVWIHGNPARTFPGTVLDVSRRGFLCEIAGTPDALELFREGVAIEYHAPDSIDLFPHGRVRHVAETEQNRFLPDGSEQRVIQIGVETGVRHGMLRNHEIAADEWENRVQQIRAGAPKTGDFDAGRRIIYRNSRGQELVALENRVDAAEGNDAVAPTVVIIPPAFGKKKEHPAPLALTICETFRRAGAPVVVIRFDGINRPGESHNDGEAPVRGYEMLHYRPTQGVDDITATLDYLTGAADYTPGTVVLVTSSMSSVDARKLLVREERIDGWVSLMGVPAARTTLMNVLAGTDIIGNYRLKIPNGIRGMLGHLVDMDSLARDLVEERYAFLTDARYDMANIAVPVLWISGEHDHWVDVSEVEDIMSVEAKAPRELVRIPTGHNLRNSDDAAEAFRMIAQYCADLAGLDVVAGAPSKESVLNVLAQEREQVYQPIDTKTVTGYWYSYLLGREGESEGYDFYGNLREFRDFISREAILLDPRPGQAIADMGCGTGLLTAALLKRIVDGETMAESGEATRIVATDLIPEALKRAREKCRFLLGPGELDYDHPDVVRRGSVSVHFTAANLEPETSRPLQDFIRHRRLPVTFLKGRIDGLMDRVVDRWHTENSVDLAAYLRGDTTTLPPDTPEPDHAREIHLAARRIIDGTGVREGGIETRSYDTVAASLFISYILNQDYLLYDFHRLLTPGGRVLVSSMRPDSDVSKIFTGYIEQVDSGAADASHRAAAKAMLNEAASLFELEEEGYFRFYTEDELHRLLSDAGFRDVRVERSLGDPPQAYIATGIAVEHPPEPWEKYV